MPKLQKLAPVYERVDFLKDSLAEAVGS
jgi:hypothetical protein